MKKLLVLFVMGFCFSPVYAQRNFWRGLTHWRTPAVQTGSISTRVKSTITRTWLQATRPANSYIQITNLPGKPLVKLAVPLVARDEMSTRQFSVLPVRAFNGIESHRTLLPEEHSFSPVYVPVALNAAEEVGV